MVHAVQHKVIITGTGRAGTTLLMQLLTALGMDTGYQDIHDTVLDYCNAGMERSLRDPDAPYIIKSPWLCSDLSDELKLGDIVIDHAFIPIRNLHDAASSRIAVWEKTGHARDGVWFNLPGSLWRTNKPHEQEAVLTTQLYKLICAITEHDIPHTFIEFPRCARDAQYLFAKLQPLLANVSCTAFLDAFDRVVDTSLIHDFSTPDTKSA